MTLAKKQGKDSEDVRGIETITNPNTYLEIHFIGFYHGDPKSRQQMICHGGC